MRNATLTLLAAAALSLTGACGRSPMDGRTDSSSEVPATGGATWEVSTGGVPGTGGTEREGERGTGGGGTGGAPPTDAGSPTTGGKGGTACSSAVIANEANDYAFWHAFTFPPVKVPPKTELTFDWSEATADLIGHAVDSKRNIDTILIYGWKLSLEELQDKLAGDRLVSNDMTIKPPLLYPTDGTRTSAGLFEFAFNGSLIGGEGSALTKERVMTFFDPASFPSTGHVFTMMAASGDVIGQGTRMIQSFQLDPNATNTMVKMTASSAKLTYTVDLHSLSPTLVPSAKADLTIEWGRLKTDAFGAPFLATDITHVVVAHYSQTPAELEARFLDLELIAIDWYEGDIDSGTKAKLWQLRSRSGTVFPGIDDSGTWLLGLQCDVCRSPAPLYLTILKACSN